MLKHTVTKLKMAALCVHTCACVCVNVYVRLRVVLQQQQQCWQHHNGAGDVTHHISEPLGEVAGHCLRDYVINLLLTTGIHIEVFSFAQTLRSTFQSTSSSYLLGCNRGKLLGIIVICTFTQIPHSQAQRRYQLKTGGLTEEHPVQTVIKVQLTQLKCLSV